MGAAGAPGWQARFATLGVPTTPKFTKGLPMNKVLFGYDLNKQAKRSEYTALIAKIKLTFPNYWHCLDSTWIVETGWTPSQVRDWLSPLLDANDELFSVDITGKAAAWQGFAGDCSSWLKNNL